MARQRRTSRLGGEPRGDTGAPAFATATVQELSPTSSPPPLLSNPWALLVKSLFSLFSDISCLTGRGLSSRSRKPFKERKERSAWQRYRSFSLRHTWLNPLILILVIHSAYLVHPTASNPVYAAIFLSYPLPGTYDGPKLYGKGAKDLGFVAFYTVVLSFTREFLMQRVIHPWALYYGLRSRGKISRFMEQVYSAMYFSIFVPLGLYIMSNSSIWYFNTTAMFEGFPHRELEGMFKAYYLLQASYWAQQALVLILQLEKPRKDFKELVAHHIITLALIWLSYRFHFTYMGLAVFITHDISDWFLATSRTLNYLDSPFVGPYYGAFVLVWIYTRHYLNLRILWAVLTEFATVGPYDLNWETEQYKCWLSQIITFVLLAGLQVLNLIWVFLILRILWNYVVTRVPRDETSDTED